MKSRVLALAILILLLPMISHAANLLFSEEFDGPLDYSTDPAETTSKWYLKDLQKGWGTIGVGSCAMAANFSVADGMGVITMREENQVCEGVSHDWTSAEISTLGRFSFTHGYAEARIKVPQGRGLYSAWWTFPSAWIPYRPEHDIFEFPYGDNPAYMTYHYVYGGEEASSGSSYTIPNFTDWHVWSLTWETGLLIWKVDGVEYHRIEGATVPETDELVSLFLTMYAGGNWVGEYPDASTNLPQSMYIDYVRVWDAEPGAGGDTTAPYTDTNVPGKYQTNVSVTQRTVSMNVRDLVGVTRSSISVTIDGSVKTCASGLNCTPAGDGETSYSVVYTNIVDWDFSTTHTVEVYAQDAALNTLNESYTFTTSPESQTQESLLPGVTPSSFTPPQGWSTVVTQDFEGTSLPASQGTTLLTSFSTDRPHSGNKSLKGTYTYNAADVSWWLRSGQTGDFSEIYVSFYDYQESQMRFNDELFLADIGKYNGSDILQFQLTLDYYGIGEGPAPAYTGFNADYTYMVLVSNSVTGDGYATNGNYWWQQESTKGQWIQWEIHYKPNTVTNGVANADGFYRVYKDGVLYRNIENDVLNGTTDWTQPYIQVGGVYTKLKWETSEGSGVCTDYIGQGWGEAQINIQFDNCPCVNQCPPSGVVPEYSRFLDDVVIMKKTIVEPVGESLLGGMTPSSYTLPEGWTLIRAQDFEGTEPDDELWGMWNGDIASDKSHSGTQAVKGTYTGDQSSNGWQLAESTLGNYNELYVSWWEWMDPAARFNDELFHLHLVTPTGSTPWQEIVLDWFEGYPSAESYDMTYNGTYSHMTYVMQGDITTRSFFKHDNPATGTWVQWEFHLKPAIGTNAGFARLYQNGALYNSLENYTVSLGANFADAQLTIGGTYSMGCWFSIPTEDCGLAIVPDACSAGPGQGLNMGACFTDYCGSFSNPRCSPTQPSTPNWDRYWDDVIVMTLGGADTQPPYTNGNSPGKSSTGWPVDSRDVSFYVRDGTNVTRSTIAMTINGTTVTPTITPTGATATSYLVSYTRGSNWADNTTYTVGITAQDVYSNTLTESYTFQTEAAAPVTLAVTTTTLDNAVTGTAFSATLAATGGVSPYTWDNTTVLPAGLNIPPGGTGTWGIPTAASSGNITVRVTDSLGYTDTQVISFTVNAGTYTTISTTSVLDTYLNKGSTTQNYSTSSEMDLLTTPANTRASDILMKWSLSALPEGAVVQSAYVRLYMTGYEGTGGDNTYAAQVRRITGVMPIVSQASWSYYNGSTPWSGGADGGLSDAGASEGTVSITKSPLYYIVNVTNMVKAWWADSATNKGVLIVPPLNASNNTNREFATSEHPTSAFRPVLYITYVPSPTPVKSLSGGILTGGWIE